MKVIGYGICGPGEAKRYMRETLEEFQRLCDEVVILCNNTGPEEKALIYEFGFRMVQDHREWGKLQWKIKQDFLDTHIRRKAEPGDVMVGLDMDERFDKHLTREWLLAMPFEAVHTFVVDLWNDEHHYKPKSSFWKVQIWRWNGNVEWTKKPLHCGLAPRWAASYNRYAPFLMIHKGLMDPENRKRKIERYEKYDPHAQFLSKAYYHHTLHSDTAEPFDEERLHATIEAEVKTYQQSKPRTATMSQPKGRFAYVRNPGGVVVDIPERMLDETLKRGGFEFIGWADDAAAEIEEMFSDDEGEKTIKKGDVLHRARVGKDEVEDRRQRLRGGSYQRPAADEKAEVDARNMKTDAEIASDVDVVEEMMQDVDVPAPEPEPPAEPAPAPAKKPVKKATKTKK